MKKPITVQREPRTLFVRRPDIESSFSSAVGRVASLDYDLTHSSTAGSVCPSIKDWPQVPSSGENVANVLGATEDSILAVVRIKEHTAQDDH